MIDDILTIKDKLFLKKFNEWLNETLIFEINKKAMDSENIVGMTIFIDGHFYSTTVLFAEIEKRIKSSMIYEDHVERVYDQLQSVLHKMGKYDQEKTLFIFQKSYGIDNINSIHSDANQARKEAIEALQG